MNHGSSIMVQANRVSGQSKESQSARKQASKQVSKQASKQAAGRQASKCFLGDETRRRRKRRWRRGEGWSTSVRPYLRPDDRCRGPSLDKLSFVPSLPPRCQSVYSTALSVCLYSILVPPPISVSVARARASSFGTGFEWTANTHCAQRRRSLESRRNWAQDQEEPSRSAMPAVPTTMTNIPVQRFSRINDRSESVSRRKRIEESVYRCEKLREREREINGTGESKESDSFDIT